MAILKPLEKLTGSFHMPRAAETYSTRNFTIDEENTKVGEYFKEACDELIVDVQTESSAFYNSLIVTAGSADWVEINTRLPIGTKLEDLGIDSYYARFQSRSAPGTAEVLFLRAKGVTYKFQTREQAAAIYWIINKNVARRHLTDLESTAPNTEQAAKLTDLDNKNAVDIAVFCSDNCSPNCNYSMYTSFTEPIPNGKEFGRTS